MPHQYAEVITKLLKQIAHVKSAHQVLHQMQEKDHAKDLHAQLGLVYNLMDNVHQIIAHQDIKMFKQVHSKDNVLHALIGKSLPQVQDHACFLHAHQDKLITDKVLAIHANVEEQFQPTEEIVKHQEQ